MLPPTFNILKDTNNPKGAHIKEKDHLPLLGVGPVIAAGQVLIKQVYSLVPKTLIKRKGDAPIKTAGIDIGTTIIRAVAADGLCVTRKYTTQNDRALHPEHPYLARETWRLNPLRYLSGKLTFSIAFDKINN